MNNKLLGLTRGVGPCCLKKQAFKKCIILKRSALLLKYYILIKNNFNSHIIKYFLYFGTIFYDHQTCYLNYYYHEKSA